MRKQQTPTTICHNDNKLHQLIFDFGKEEQRLYMEFVKSCHPVLTSLPPAIFGLLAEFTCQVFRAPVGAG